MKKNKAVILCIAMFLMVALGACGQKAVTMGQNQGSSNDSVNEPVDVPVDVPEEDTPSIKGNAIIDWVDFVKMNGRSYSGLYAGVLVDGRDVTDHAVGEVKFMVSGAVSNPEYKTKDGDAAFLPIGTKLFEVKGFKPEELVAVEDKNVVGGYRLYAEDAYFKTIHRNFKDVPYDKVSQIELYKMNDTAPYRTLAGSEKTEFIHLLRSGENSPNYNPSSENGDPVYYHMVFYTDEPIAHSFSIADDGEHVYFHPWDTSIVDNRILTLMATNSNSNSNSNSNESS